MLIATHCEDEATIRRNTVYYKQNFGDDLPFRVHPIIRSELACYLRALPPARIYLVALLSRPPLREGTKSQRFYLITNPSIRDMIRWKPGMISPCLLAVIGVVKATGPVATVYFCVGEHCFETPKFTPKRRAKRHCLLAWLAVGLFFGLPPSYR